MSFRQRSDTAPSAEGPPSELGRSRLSELAARLGDWFVGVEGDLLSADDEAEPLEAVSPSPDLPLDLPLDLPPRVPPVSIAEELERIGEQTASILVVAHDQAAETRRRAQEEADRCIARAAADAVNITAQAKQRLADLDAETEAVWRERERLLQDLRVTAMALSTLADEAAQRFPAEDKGADATADPAHLPG
jgi:hypothetical protein